LSIGFGTSRDGRWVEVGGNVIASAHGRLI